MTPAILLTNSSYAKQSLCAVKLMGEIVDELKRLGHYNKSLTIFQSDHGWQLDQQGLTEVPGNPTFEMFPPEIAQQVANVNSYYDFWSRFHALLAIKRPMAEKKPLQVAEVQTQLLDIPATLYDVLGINARAPEGQSVFSLSEDSAREIHVFTGLHFKNKEGEGMLGRDVTKLNFAHLSYEPGRGWRHYPDVLAFHEGW